MGFIEWAWGVYEYLCFLIGGIIVAFNEANPYSRIKRKHYHKLPSVCLQSSFYPNLFVLMMFF